MALISLVTAILATYRLAHLFPEDEGPLFIFTRIRSFIATKAMNENNELGIWANIDSGINCVYCCGLYAAILTVFLSEKKAKWSNLFLLVFAIAGGSKKNVKTIYTVIN